MVGTSLFAQKPCPKKLDVSSAIESAQEACNLAQSINKTLHAESLLTLAELLSLTGNNLSKIEVLQTFMQVSKLPVGIDVTWSRVYEMLGDSYFATAKYTEAITAYQSALRYNPDHPWEETIYYRIAKAHYQERQYAETIENLKLLITDCEDYRIFNLLANALYGLRHFREAAQAYHQAIDLAPVGVDVETMQYYYQLSQQMNSPL